ncbi:MAG TPA: hypothetical protein VNA66_03900 [Gammaproteobacteria bacterium]|jgi:hypothetical protein|nr:hypothetical protein [Gammaproteobacteria bacterium]
MSRRARVLHAALAVLCAAAVLSTTAQPEAGTFTTVDVFVDSDTPVAAWQVELTERRGAMQIVGIERGDNATFRDPPFYDRVATMRGATERIVLASYSLSDAAQLPSGKVRIARVHVRATGAAQPDYEARLIAAGTADGRSIDAQLSLETQAGR